MKKNVLLMLLIAMITMTVAFAGGSSEKEAEGPKTLTVLGTWVASEGEAFEYVLQGFTEKTGIPVIYEGVNDPTAVLGTRIAGGDLPDAAVLGGGEGFLTYADLGVLEPIDFMKDIINENYDSGWIVPLTIDGSILSVPIRCNVQNCLFFNPETLPEGVDLESWDGFIEYLDSQAAAGKSSLAGFYKLNWGSSIIFDSVLSTVATLEEYRQFMTGHMAFDDPVVIAAAARMAELVEKYMPGGAEGALGTDMTEGFALVFGTQPVAQFINAGSWGSGIVTGGVNADIVPGESITYVIMPGYNAIETNFDNIVMFVDSDECRQLMEYLATAEAAERFAVYDYVVPNKNVDVEIYKDPLAKVSMEYLKNPVVVPTAVNPAEYMNAFYQTLQAIMADPANVASLCKEFEEGYGELRSII